MQDDDENVYFACLKYSVTNYLTDSRSNTSTHFLEKLIESMNVVYTSVNDAEVKKTMIAWVVANEGKQNLAAKFLNQFSAIKNTKPEVSLVEDNLSNSNPPILN